MHDSEDLTGNTGGSDSANRRQSSSSLTSETEHATPEASKKGAEAERSVKIIRDANTMRPLGSSGILVDARAQYRDYSRDMPSRAEEHRGAQNFPMELYRILATPEFQDIISWLPHGRAWRILQHSAFEEQVIPLFFRHGRYSSFARQVNGWDFKRITSGPDYNAYYHELFLRGKPHLCRRMKRLGSKEHRQREGEREHDSGARGRHGRRKSSGVNDNHTPDFYAISRDYPLPELPKEPPSRPLLKTVPESVTSNSGFQNASGPPVFATAAGTMPAAFPGGAQGTSVLPAALNGAQMGGMPDMSQLVRFLQQQQAPNFPQSGAMLPSVTSQPQTQPLQLQPSQQAILDQMLRALGMPVQATSTGGTGPSFTQNRGQGQMNPLDVSSSNSHQPSAGTQIQQLQNLFSQVSNAAYAPSIAQGVQSFQPPQLSNQQVNFSANGSATSPPIQAQTSAPGASSTAANNFVKNLLSQLLLRAATSNQAQPASSNVGTLAQGQSIPNVQVSSVPNNVQGITPEVLVALAQQLGGGSMASASAMAPPPAPPSLDVSTIQALLTGGPAGITNLLAQQRSGVPLGTMANSMPLQQNRPLLNRGDTNSGSNSSDSQAAAVTNSSGSGSTPSGADTSSSGNGRLPSSQARMSLRTQPSGSGDHSSSQASSVGQEQSSLSSSAVPTQSLDADQLRQLQMLLQQVQGATTAPHRQGNPSADLQSQFMAQLQQLASGQAVASAGGEGSGGQNESQGRDQNENSNSQ